MNSHRVLAAALLALAGCGAMEWPEPAETEALLAAAGLERQIERHLGAPLTQALPRA